MLTHEALPNLILKLGLPFLKIPDSLLIIQKSLINLLTFSRLLAFLLSEVVSSTFLWNLILLLLLLDS